MQSRKSRHTWSNKQIWPWNTKWSKSKANRVLPREHPGHSKYLFPKTQKITLPMDVTSWSIEKSDWLYFLYLNLEKINTVSRTRPRPVADCVYDHELFIAKYKLTLKKIGKTTKPFRYDLNQIPVITQLGVMNKFKGLDLVFRMPKELCMLLSYFSCFRLCATP